MDDQRTNQEGSGMKYRKLRIAWSVGCGIACLLVIALWVRSYRWSDTITGPLPNGNLFFAHSIVARTVYGVSWLDTGRTIEWKIESDGRADGSNFDWRAAPEQLSGFTYWVDQHEVGVIIPHWFVAVLLATPATLPWVFCRFRPRFSLRALLIAMTLVAVVLGLIVLL